MIRTYNSMNIEYSVQMFWSTEDEAYIAFFRRASWVYV